MSNNHCLENNVEDFEDFHNEATRKIVLHVYDDESKEFSSLTTYHGMVRIYNSTNWPSLIFWCLVVTICLILFMVHSGYLLTVYRNRSTFLNSKRIRNNFPKNIKPVFTFCEKDINSSIYSNPFNQSFSCANFFTQIKIDNNQIINCNDVSNYFYSQFGHCFTLNFPTFSFSNKLSVLINRTIFKELAFEVHDKETPSNIFAHGIHVFKGAHLMSQISVATQQFLEKGLWGKCEEVEDDQFYTLEKCQQKCLKDVLLKECKCLPYYFGGNQKSECENKCVQNVLLKMKPCNCSLPCNRIHFSVRETSIAKLIPSLKNYSKITVIFKDKSLLTQNQNQRLITVDLLSFVAGSMGLFLGMSCITLLEVFMYLFKSAWGTMNNARYKAYLSKLLGENVSNFLHTDPDMSRSHEEIVITQTTNPENPELNNLPPVTLQIKQSLTNRNSFESPTTNSLKQSFDAF
uniref:Uncharacterized protein n=1 Tax=Panagrolaimus sp. PS1159 TaxID=55785 RepID=A0AC35G318_9BILA